jgi:hypothetical protein
VFVASFGDGWTKNEMLADLQFHDCARPLVQRMDGRSIERKLVLVNALTKMAEVPWYYSIHIKNKRLYAFRPSAKRNEKE